MSVVVALGTGLAAWWLHSTRWQPVVLVFVIATLVLVVGAGLGLALYPWTDLPVIAIALAGGLLVARALPPWATPMLVLLGVLAALDSLQLLIPGPGRAQRVPLAPRCSFTGCW